MAKQLGIKSNKPFGLDNLLTGSPAYLETMETVQPSSLNNEIEEEIPEPISEIIEETNSIEQDIDTTIKKKPGRPKSSTKIAKRSAEVGTMEGEMRYTAIVNEDLLNTIKKIAYWERLKMKDMFNFALESFIEEYTTKYGEIKEIPSKKRI